MKAKPGNVGEAFKAGFDAALRGRSTGHNPFRRRKDAALFTNWYAGWWVGRRELPRPLLPFGGSVDAAADARKGA